MALVVHLVAETEPDRDRLSRQVDDVLEGTGVDYGKRPAATGGPLPTLASLERSACGLVVLPKSLAAAESSAVLDRVLRRLGCPVLVVRQE